MTDRHAKGRGHSTQKLRVERDRRMEATVVPVSLMRSLNAMSVTHIFSKEASVISLLALGFLHLLLLQLLYIRLSLGPDFNNSQHDDQLTMTCNKLWHNRVMGTALDSYHKFNSWQFYPAIQAPLFTFRIRRIRCHSNQTRAPIANQPPNSAQLGGTPTIPHSYTWDHAVV